MLSEEVRSVIETGLKIVGRDKGVSQFEAEERASSLLIIAAELYKQKYNLENKLIKSSSIQRVSFSKSIHEAEGKNVTEKKVKAESDPTYIKDREESEELENDVSYLKAIIEIFQNAHIMWRQIAKNEG
jgi:hypothetical protein